MQYIKSVFKNKISYLVILLCLVTVAVPTKSKRRIVAMASTPIVLPVEKSSFYLSKHFRKYEHHILAASEEYGVPVSLIAAVISAESHFNPYARSRTGAKGLMQLMPATWMEMGGIGSPYNPGQNIKLGTKYLRELLDMFRGNLYLTIAAYNAGPGAVRKYRRIPPYRETRRYVPRVLSYYRKFKKLNNLS